MHHKTLTTVTFTFCNYYVLKLLRLETIMFSDALLNDINVVLCYVVSQYHIIYMLCVKGTHGNEKKQLLHRLICYFV
jgi:hypothetical protein